jgi:hypothetical protein
MNSGRLLSILIETEDQLWIVHVVMPKRGLVIVEVNLRPRLAPSVAQPGLLRISLVANVSVEGAG